MSTKELVEWARSPAPEKEHWKRAQKRAEVLKCAEVLTQCDAPLSKSWKATVERIKIIQRLPKIGRLKFGEKPKSNTPYSAQIIAKGKAMGLQVVNFEGGAFLYDR